MWDKYCRYKTCKVKERHERSHPDCDYKEPKQRPMMGLKRPVRVGKVLKGEFGSR
jgi:hypothetical protein